MKYFLLCILLSYSMLCDAALVRVKDIIQYGKGKNGIIELRLTSSYDSSKITTNFTDEYLELVLKDTFVIPVSKTYSPSSPKSSVLKMELLQVPTNSVRARVYFRVDIDIIRNTAKLNTSGNKIIVNYSIEKNAKPIQVASSVVHEVEEKSSKEQIEEKSVLQKASNIKVTPSKSDTPSMFFTLVKVIATLSFVLALFFIGIFVFKKYFWKLSSKLKGVKTPKNSFNSDFAIAANYFIAPKKQLVVVEVEGKRLLIGVTEQNINLIIDLTESNILEEEEANFNLPREDNEKFRKDKIRNNIKKQLRSLSDF
jgi:flagellar biogenesis protein FliO